MARTARTESESSFYHLTARGCGRRRLFETNADRSFFLRQLVDGACRSEVRIKAWCLMENHFHLLVSGNLKGIAQLMHRLCTVFALYFNTKYDHVGHVFQGRYHSTPVESDEQLLATIRYIHLNPVVDGISSLGQYKWSSYAQYIGERGFCDLDDMLELFGSVSEFKRFHESAIEALLPAPVAGPLPRLSDTEAAHMAAARFGKQFADEIPGLPRERRDEALRNLARMGMSVRQIERLTGIGRGIVHRACKS